MSLGTLAQNPSIEARYFDETGNPTRVERQYLNGTDSGEIYLVLFNNGFYGIKYRQWMSSDTVVDQYAYFRLPNPYPQLDRYHAAGSQLISSSQNRDTLSIEWTDDDNQKVGDTLLVGSQIAQFDALQDRYFNHRLGMVLSGGVIVNPDRMTLMETWQYRWVGDRPISFMILDANGERSNLATYSTTSTSLTGQHYFVYGPDSMEHYAIDSLRWDAERTTLKAIRYDLDPEETHSTTLAFSTLSYKRMDSDGTTVVEYTKDTKPWPLKLIHETFEEGPTVSCQLLTFQNERLNRWVYPNGSTSIHEYQLNEQGQPVEVRVLKDGKLNRRVEYTYAQNK